MSPKRGFEVLCDYEGKLAPSRLTDSELEHVRNGHRESHFPIECDVRPIEFVRLVFMALLGLAGLAAMLALGSSAPAAVGAAIKGNSSVAGSGQNLDNERPPLDSTGARNDNPGRL